MQRAERDRRAAQQRVDQVGHAGRSRGHLPRAEAVQEDAAHGVAHDPDGVEGPSTWANVDRCRTSVGETCSSSPSGTNSATAKSLML